MEVQLTSTDRIVVINPGREEIAGRVWEGTTASGIRVYAIIPRIAVHNDDDHSQFEAELKECKPPSPEATTVFPARLIL